MTEPAVARLLGLDQSHLVPLPGGQLLHPDAAVALARLQAEAAEAGFDLAIASAYRSFERQCLIWNGKVRGERALHDDAGCLLVHDALSEQELLHAILRFSALPGTSRHHWGSDLDVYDANALGADNQVQLIPAEVCPGGVFDPLHCWLDERIRHDQSQGFFRPYALDRGGVAPERWHLSFAPLATVCEAVCYRQALADALIAAELAMVEPVCAALEELLTRYVAVPADWCPAHYRQ